MFNTLEKAIQWLEIQTKFKQKSDLDRMKKAYSMLNIDLSAMKKIHVAGTNGKGSVASYLTHILMEEHLKVGTFTSPYLVRFNERMKINMKDIPDHDLLPLTNEIYDFNRMFEESYGDSLTFFELLTLMALIYFKRQNVEVIVMEVGLGGLLDATNVIYYDVSLITSIGFDHMKQLGNTLESIAYNKLGILKPHNHLITTVDPSLKPLFESYVKNIQGTMTHIDIADATIKQDNPLIFNYKNIDYQLSLKGSYQVLNALLSIEAIKYVFPSISEENIVKGLKKTLWSGRLEEIDYQIFLDGAHNTHAIEALKETVSKTFKGYDIWILFSALGDKDIKGMLDICQSFAKRVVLTSFPDPRFDLSQLSHEFPYIENPMNAIEKLKKEMPHNVILIITGSLHFVGYIKKMYYRTC